MKYIILDLEATCWEQRDNGKTSEIIEIGAVLIDNEGQQISEFAKFVKPSLNPVLSDFCTQLTTITQEDVEAASGFSEVVAEFQEWFGMNEGDYLLGSWGFYDKSQLKKDCQLHGLPFVWLKPHISVKHQHQKLKGLEKPLGMAQALKMEGFQLDGTHHRGIDDARNIAKIFGKYLKDWKH